jgi:hypothetical protein
MIEESKSNQYTRNEDTREADGVVQAMCKRFGGLR